MRNLWYLVLGMMLWSCAGPATDGGDATATSPPMDPYGISDSVRQLYQRYQTALEDPMPLSCRPERGKVNPADAAPSDTTFFVFREHLRQVVADKDIFGLLGQVDEQIKIGFGADNGLKAFIRAWELDSPEKVPESQLWPELAEVLSLGGQFSGQGDYFEAPYLDPCFPPSTTIDIMESVVVTGAGVRMRSGPGLNTQVLKTLSYDILQFIETTPIEERIGGEVHTWVQVKTLDGVEGFVYGKFLRSPIDLRAGFRRAENGRWKLVTLLAGD
jgi:hypothetical protein